MATASVTLSLNQSAFLAGMARARASVSGLGSSIASIGARGIVAAGAAIAGLGVAAAVGIKKAFDFGGKLADMSAISGKSARQILLLRRALEDAGISMEKIDRYILTGQDRGQVIARALENMSAADWTDAARSVGKQADILEQNAATFDRVSDLMGRATDKLRGFFVGAASSIGKALLPILEKFDKMDFAAQGQKFGDGLLKGAQALAGFFNDPQKLLGVFQDSFTAVILSIGNLMISVFTKAFTVLQAGAQAMFESLMNPAEGGKGLLNAIDRFAIKAFGKDMSGNENTAVVKFFQEQIDKREEAAKGFERTGIGNRMLDIANKSPLQVTDFLGSKDALKNAQKGIIEAGKIGRNILPPEMAAGGRGKLEDSYKAQELIRSQIATSTQTGLGEFKGFGEFESQWGTPKPSEIGGGREKDSGVPDAVKEAMEVTMEKYWGSK